MDVWTFDGDLCNFFALLHFNDTRSSRVHRVWSKVVWTRWMTRWVSWMDGCGGYIQRNEKKSFSGSLDGLAVVPALRALRDLVREVPTETE